MSGWVFPILPEDLLEISDRNSELLRRELTVNIQRVFVAGLCRCYFFNNLLKKGVIFNLMKHDWHLSSSLQERQNEQKERKAKTLQTAEKAGGEPVLHQPRGVLSNREILSKSPFKCGRVRCAVGVFSNKNAARCNPKPYNKFWPELGICSVLLCSWGAEVANFS